MASYGYHLATPPLPNPMTMLSEIYQRLTGKCATTNISILQSEIRLLVSNPSCKLLVILDDVWEAKDAMMFVDVFSNQQTHCYARDLHFTHCCAVVLEIFISGHFF